MIVVEMMMAFIGVFFILGAYIMRKVCEKKDQAVTYVGSTKVVSGTVSFLKDKAVRVKNKAFEGRLACEDQAMRRMTPEAHAFFDSIS
jgi:hypothetical protein